MECDELPAEASSGGFDQVTPRTGAHRDFVAGVSGVFTCANLGRLSDDYGTFSHEVQCEYKPEEQRAVLTGAPDAWGTCKTCKFNLNTKLLESFNQNFTTSCIARSPSTGARSKRETGPLHASCPAIPSAPPGMQSRRVSTESKFGV